MISRRTVLKVFGGLLAGSLCELKNQPIQTKENLKEPEISINEKDSLSSMNFIKLRVHRIEFDIFKCSAQIRPMIVLFSVGSTLKFNGWIENFSQDKNHYCNIKLGCSNFDKVDLETEAYVFHIIRKKENEFVILTKFFSYNDSYLSQISKYHASHYQRLLKGLDNN